MKSKLTIILAFLAVYIFWGGTYVGMKIALGSFNPFVMASIRHLSAGLILFTISRFRKDPLPTWIELKNSAIVGILLLCIGNGLVAYAEKTVPSSIASLIVASVPLWMTLLNWMGHDKEKPSLVHILGLSLGIIGIILLVSQGSSDKTTGYDIIGMLLLCVAALAWATGSMYARKSNIPKAALVNVSTQMLAGGSTLLVFSLLTGQWNTINPSMISTNALWAVAYLIIFGSIVGYTAYIWLMQHVHPTWVSTYAFVNPVVAVILGWILLKETLHLQSLLSALIIVVAVSLITLAKKTR